MWVVDTCVLIDVLEDDPEFGRMSADSLAGHLHDGLVVSPITYAELSPAFGGSCILQDEFLGGIGAGWKELWTAADTLAAHRAWGVHVARRRAGAAQKRPMADVLIGAFATRFMGLITRNTKDFRQHFPALRLVDPSGRR